MAQVYENPTDGITIGLTIDLNLQKAVEGALDEIVSKYTPEHALILAMDPQSGEILAMGSRPGFDPNNYKDYDTQTINRNLPIWMTYEPGSTFKIITLASSIEEKLLIYSKILLLIVVQLMLRVQHYTVGNMVVMERKLILR